MSMDHSAGNAVDRCDHRTATTTTAPAMTPDEVIAALSYIKQGQSPRAALEAAMTMREELTPRLLEVLALAPVDVEARQAATDDATAYYLHIFAFYLLAAYREPRAWPLMLDYFVSDADLADKLSGDAFSDDLSGLLVHCYDGKGVGYLERLIETPSLNVSFRQHSLSAYHGLVLTGQAERDRFIAFVARQLDAPGAEQHEWFDWLAINAAHIREPSLKGKIEALWDRGLIAHSGFMTLLRRADVAEIYAEKPHDRHADRFIVREELFADFVDTICRWYWFQPPRQPRPHMSVENWLEYQTSRPVVRVEAKTGRNEPCPCGSGKKYKKCCLD